MIGLCGAHRTGKTTLAKAFAERFGVPYVDVNTRGVVESMGLKLEEIEDFETRLRLQHAILDNAIEIYRKAPAVFITDRTPIDMAAYMLCDCRIQMTVAESNAVMEYVQRCLEATTIFSLLIYVPTGLEYVEEPNKPPLNIAYQEMHGLLVRGLIEDQRLGMPAYSISRHCLGLEERVNAVASIYNDMIKEFQRVKESVTWQ